MRRVMFTLVLGGLLVSGPAALAKPAFLKKAKDISLPDITTCQACHVSTTKPNVKWNERGLWLRAKKQEMHAEDVDVVWLKDYKPAT